MSVGRDLLALVEACDARLVLPRVARLHVPRRTEEAGMQDEFGAVVLEDGSAGFFFALLGDTLAALHAQVDDADAAGRSPLAIASSIASDDNVARAVALGAISAVTQHVFTRACYRPPAAPNSLGGEAFGPGDHVGMVGLFPSLARRLREQGVMLTVLELRADKVERAERFEVTLDPARLARCNTVLCTASTLINGTLDTVLAACANAEHISLIGPTASCFPDPMFARRISALGGARVVDTPALLARLDVSAPWADAVERYVIEPDEYPGFEALVERAARASSG